jgi:hypothetical protein
VARWHACKVQTPRVVSASCAWSSSVAIPPAHLCSDGVVLPASGLGCSGDAMGTGLRGKEPQRLGLPKSAAGEPSACCESQELHRRMRRLPLHFCALGRPGRRPKHLARSCSNSDVRRPAQGRTMMSSTSGSPVHRTLERCSACRCTCRKRGRKRATKPLTGLWKGSSQGAQRLCFAASIAPVAMLIAHSTAAHVVTQAGSGGRAHLRQTVQHGLVLTVLCTSMLRKQGPEFDRSPRLSLHNAGGKPARSPGKRRRTAATGQPAQLERARR